MSSNVRPFPVPADDANLRAQFARGDRGAFAMLARPNLDALYTVCVRMLGDGADAEDVAQEALVRAIDRCHHYDARRPFRPWLLSIATNLCRDRLRTVWWRRVLPWSSSAEPASAPELTLHSEGARRDAMVRKALLELPPMYREAITLFHLEDMSYHQMEEITGVSQPALKQRVRRGTLLLRDLMAKMYPELADIRTPDDPA